MSDGCWVSLSLSPHFKAQLNSGDVSNPFHMGLLPLHSFRSMASENIYPFCGEYNREWGSQLDFKELKGFKKRLVHAVYGFFLKHTVFRTL